MRLEKSLKVGASIVDPNADLSLIGLFQIVEDTVTELMGELKIDGITARNKYNAVMVFTKNRLKIFKNVAWNDTAKISGYISSKSRATICVDVAVKNKLGELCAYARVEVCALDFETGRIRRIDTVGVDDGVKAETPEADIEFAKIGPAELSEKERVLIRYTNVDYSRHTNNVEYVRFILNTYSVKELTEKPVKEMEVVYKNQSFENDELTIYKGKDGNKDVFVLKSGDKTVTQSEIVFCADK